MNTFLFQYQSSKKELKQTETSLQQHKDALKELAASMCFISQKQPQNGAPA